MRPDTRITILLAVLAAVAVAGLGGPAAASQADEVTLTVTAVDESGQPISGVELSATWDGGGPVNETTRSNGKALLDVPAGADVEIRAAHPSYALPAPVVVEDASERDVEVELTPTGNATITVEDDDGPVSNAVVRLFRDGTVVANERTAEDGSLTVERLARGEYRVVAFKEGYLRTEGTITVDGDVSRTAVIEPDSALVTVAVRDADADRPVRNATVRIGDVGQAQTLGDGRARLGVPVNARFEVTVAKDGYETATEELRVRESDARLNVSLSPAGGLSVEASAERVAVGETVTVTVTDGTGDPVESANVTVDGTVVGQTDADGRLDVSLDSAGENRIEVTDGDATASVTVEGVTDTGTGTATATATGADGGDGEGSDGSLLGPLVAILLVLALAAGVGLAVVRRRESGPW